MLQFSGFILVGNEGIEPPTLRSTTELIPSKSVHYEH